MEITEDGQLLGACETPRLVVADGGKATAQFGMIADEMAADIAPMTHASIRATGRAKAPARQGIREVATGPQANLPNWMDKSKKEAVPLEALAEPIVEIKTEREAAPLTVAAEHGQLEMTWLLPRQNRGRKSSRRWRSLRLALRKLPRKRAKNLQVPKGPSTRLFPKSCW